MSHFSSGAAEALDTQRADYLQNVQAAGYLEPDILATPLASRRNRIVRGTAKVVGAIGLASAALGVIDAYNGVTHDIPEAKTAVVSDIKELDMTETDKAISTSLFTEKAAAQIGETAAEVQQATQAHSAELDAAFTKTTSGIVQTGVGSGLFLAGAGTTLALNRRNRNRLGSSTMLRDANHISDTVMPNRLYTDRLGRRHVSRTSSTDNSPILELKPSGKYKEHLDHIEIKALSASATLLASLVLAGSPLAEVAARSVDETVNTLKNTSPVATSSNYIAQEALKLAKPAIEDDIKRTTHGIIEDKLPRTTKLAQTLPLMKAVKEKVANDVAKQVVDSQLKPTKNRPTDTYPLSDMQADITNGLNTPTKGLIGTMGIVGVVGNRAIRRRSHYFTSKHSAVRVSQAFLDTHSKDLAK
ncbi:MAG TPA: hypothetical protein VFI74_06155 [Candidatus Saccharimonadales bacterium]|nr:hypothetical protein [Candidatus Saccharimonadales bacterium]